MSKRIYVAMDVHLKSITSKWQNRGSSRKKLTIEATSEGLAKLQRAVGEGEIWAVYEASSCGFEVYDRLTEAGWKVWLLAPTHLKRSTDSRKNKNDGRDTDEMLDVLVGFGELGTKLPWAWVPPVKTREDREVVRRRLKLAEKLTQVKNEITGLLRSQAMRRPEEFRTAWSAKHVAWIRGLRLSAPVKAVMEGLLEELGFYQDQLRKMDKAVQQLSEEPEYRAPVERMTELDGVGILTAMVFHLEMGDPHRFQNRGAVAKYTGLTPRQHASSEMDHKGHISKMGPSRLRKVLNQAAWAHVSKGGRWAQWYEEVAKRRGKKIAVVGLMRKLAIDLWHLARAA